MTSFMTKRAADNQNVIPGGDLDVNRMPAYLLFARLGKRILRPGGRRMTQRLISGLNVTELDDVVEFAPGLGATASRLLARHPRSYVGVERDKECASVATRALAWSSAASIRVGHAHQTGLEKGFASVVVGEAMLTLQTDAKKHEIVSEASRLLRPGGRYGIHELCLVPDDMPPARKHEIARELSSVLHVAARPYTVTEWSELLHLYGFNVTHSVVGKMALLNPLRIIADEGVLGAYQFARNVSKDPDAKQRLLAIRKVLESYSSEIAASYFVAEKRVS
ncbi:class I SAM-dependent methyltransferase [Rhizobium sp.]|uniref:class I SAM-dependent methyltransferase n=1 Tax=Rhizobium sp. TaxID=391 RepID=UPI0028A731E9